MTKQSCPASAACVRRARERENREREREQVSQAARLLPTLLLLSKCDGKPLAADSLSRCGERKEEKEGGRTAVGSPNLESK